MSIPMIKARVTKDQSLKQAVDAFQSDYIQQVLAENERNWAATARQLKLDPGNLHRLAKRLGLKS